MYVQTITEKDIFSLLLPIPFIDVSERKGWAVVDTALCFIAYGLVQGDQLPLVLLFDG